MTAVDNPPTATDTDPARRADPDPEALASAVDTARAAVAAFDEPARRAAEDLQRAVEAFHRPALVAFVRTLRADPRGKELLFELVDDPAVRTVLAMQGIIRAPLATRTQQALDSVRPYLQSHGGDVDLVDLRDGVAVVRLRGSCNGCSMSAVTLREGVEEALVTGVEEITAIEVVEDEPQAAFIPLASIGRRETGWIDGPGVDDVPADGMVRFDVGEESFVITRVANRLAVFRNACAHQGNTLDGGLIDEGVIVCPWHGLRFDATSGECLSAPGAQLEQMPLRVEDGRLSIRVAGGS